MSTIAATAVIHPMAVVEPGAVIGENVRIGPFCHVGPRVTLRMGVELLSNAVVTGLTEIGANSRIFPMAVIGGVSQSLHEAGEDSRLIVGANCTMREGVTMNCGTVGGGGITASATIAFSSPIRMSPMTASSAAISSCPTMSCWPAMCRSATMLS